MDVLRSNNRVSDYSLLKTTTGPISINWYHNLLIAVLDVVTGHGGFGLFGLKEVGTFSL